MRPEKAATLSYNLSREVLRNEDTIACRRKAAVKILFRDEIGLLRTYM